METLQRQWHAGLADAPEQYDELQYMSVANVNRPSVGKADGRLEIRRRAVHPNGKTVHPNGDILRAELYCALASRENGCRETTEMVIISYIPDPHRYETGISITIHQASDLRPRTPIPPSIRTFSVVPDDAEIIRMVKKNDLSGVRRLFEEGKASPTDVNSSGHSLLSVRRLLL